MDLRELIESCGFEHVAPFDATRLEVHQEVRDMCAADRCHHYGHSWSCPPACGSIEDYRELFARYTKGYLFQTVMPMEDEFDFDSIVASEKLHHTRFDTLVRSVRQLALDVLPISAGSCTLCGECTYPDHPCLHPDLMYPSMEACGLLVYEVCAQAGIEYYHGPRTSTFVSCLLYDRAS